MQNSKGYTIIELLIASAIIAIISVISINLLWDTLTVRSKDYAIERTSDNFRDFIATMTRSIQESKSVEVPDTGTLQITGNPCRAFIFNSTDKTIEGSIDSSANCTPPNSDFLTMVDNNIEITLFEVSPIGEFLSEINIKIEGSYKDSLGSHPINYHTTVHPRINL